MIFTLNGFIFNIIGMLVLMRSEWLQQEVTATKQDHSGDEVQASTTGPDPDGAFSLWMLGGLALVFGFCMHIVALFG